MSHTETESKSLCDQTFIPNKFLTNQVVNRKGNTLKRPRVKKPFCLQTPNSLIEIYQIFRFTPLARGVNEAEGFQYHAYLSHLSFDPNTKGKRNFLEISYTNNGNVWIENARI
ncbi:hypothetical protein BpHYR1_026312 [Brachionus plicatilis]|uniref:Uncharacterized protein n=1 Tax=Brachionus plicatilis TaxID=10195 RepID=A0A3M7RN67_BRAPC|nr:hypothetical protein BpHYR1_026312 [Brachionus plicatilis]